MERPPRRLLRLAPTATRGTVRLVFDAAGRRYAVARELRRTKTGVSVRNARLDVFADAGTTEFDDAEVTNVAADSQVSPAVEELLGLSFDHFCQCVVLPQGQFSDFLRANRKQRQEILLNLLGADLYDKIRARANQRAAVALSRTALLDDQLLRLGDATDAVVAAAAARVELLTALGVEVGVRLDALAAVQQRLSAAEEAVAALDAEMLLLGGLRMPDGLAVLESARSAASGDLAVARESLTATESADTTARRALAEAPQRAGLERLLDDHGRCAALTAELPGLSADSAAAAREQAAAVAVRDQATALVAAARTSRDAAVRDAEAAAAASEAIRAELEVLGRVVIPADVADLDGRERAARAALGAAATAVTAADAAEREAADALQALPARAPLEQTLTRHRELTAAGARRKALAAEAKAANTTLTAAEKASRTADKAVGAHRAAVDEARSANTAATLRPLLVVGDSCPVCDQPVHSLPSALDAADLAAAEALLRTAEQGLADARRTESAAVADDRAARARLGDVDATVAALQSDLDGQPAESTVAATLADIDRLAAETTLAQAAVRRARDDERAAQQTADAAARSTTTAWSFLRSRRESVLALKPPTVDDLPLLDAWQHLAAWATALATDRTKRLPDVEQHATTTAVAQEAAEGDLTTAQRALDDAQIAVTETTSLARLAAENHRRADADLRALLERLSTGPTATQAKADLAELDKLESAARTANAAVLNARKAVAEAQTREAGVTRRYDTAWSDLRTARDALVPLGAPAVAGDSVTAAWATLTRWAETSRVARETKLDAARADAAAAEGELRDAETGLRDLFADHDVDAPGGELARVASARAAAALETARRDHADLVRKQAEAQRVSADRAESDSQYKVAHLLDTLLRSSRFPEWLEAAALDTLVVDASASLNELSDEQFSLTHRDGEFYVIDHADADSERSVRTLSGGETFQASLALALALSSQLSTMAVGGAAQLDSIFLDEGFGTLDPDSLELVAETLENLAKGNRMVGVITHVAALADRIPVRFTVSRDNRSSRLVREAT